MNLTHLHLLITHLPIFGSILGALVLALGLFTHSPNTRKAAYLVLLISAIGGIIAFSTGEPAEETVEHIAGISKNVIENHEASAKITLVAVILVGVSSIIGLVAAAKKCTIQGYSCRGFNSCPSLFWPGCLDRLPGWKDQAH